jgi:hypothetical protein
MDQPANERKSRIIILGVDVGTAFVTSYRDELAEMVERVAADNPSFYIPPRREVRTIHRGMRIEFELPAPMPMWHLHHFPPSTPCGAHKGKLQAPIELRAVSIYRGGPTRAQKPVRGPQRDHTWRGRRGRRLAWKSRRRT